MQADTFMDKWTKILYAISFMCRGTAQVWAGNKTTAVIDGMSQTHTLNEFLACVERTFGDLDRARTVYTQLHELKMEQGITTEDYTAQLEMLAGRTGFNDAVLEDAYIQGLPNLILQKVFAQTMLPKGLEKWKTVIHNLDRLHHGLMELRQSTGQSNTSTGQTHLSTTTTTGQSTPAVVLLPQTLDTSAPMDVD